MPDRGSSPRVANAPTAIKGALVAHRKEGKLWWLNDSRFEWDVELTGMLTPGANKIALRCHCEHHLGGMFRRPFLYRAMR